MTEQRGGIDLEFILTHRAPVLRYPRAVKMENGSMRHLPWGSERAAYYTWDGISGGLTVHASGSTAEEAFRNAIIFAEDVNANIS